MSLRFRVGVGRREITPPVGTPMSGYTPQRPCESVHDPLHIIVLVIEQGERRILLAALDVCNPGNAGKDIRSAMAEAAGVPFENTSYSATHTHSGPVTFVTPPFMNPNPEYVYGTLIPRAAEAAKEAAASLEWAEMGIGVTDSQVAVNRRQITEDGSIILGQEPLGLYDPRMTVVSFRSPAGKILCSLVHYGCHNTASGKNKEITRDWCGVMKDRLEAETGAVAMFFNGCEGDCGPRLPNGKTTGDLAMAMALGEVAAKDAVRAWQSIDRWQGELPLRRYSGTVELPYMKFPPLPELEKMIEEMGDPEALSEMDRARRRCYIRQCELMKSGKELPEALSYGQTVFALGEFAFVPSPFESFSDMTMRISRHSPFARTVVVSQSNDRLFYLPTQDQIPLGGYEVKTGVWDRIRPFVTDADRHYVSGVLRLLREMKEEA